MRGHLCAFTPTHPQRVSGVSACLGYQLRGETRDFLPKSLGSHASRWARVTPPRALSWLPITSRGLVPWACLGCAWALVVAAHIASTPAHCGLRWACAVDALERLWPSVVETRGDPPAYLGVQSLAWADVGAGRGYVWTLVVGSFGRRLWT